MMIRTTLTSLAALLLCSVSVFATSYVPMADEALMAQTPVIVEVSVLTVAPSPAAGAPSTDYVVLVERVLKGQVSGTNIVVRVAGGVGPDGRGLTIFGAPTLDENDRAILFLRPAKDGTYGVEQLMMGAFHQVTRGDRQLALRDFTDTVQVSLDGEFIEEPIRDYEAFARWLGERGEGIARPADYFVDPQTSGLSNARQSHTFLKAAGKRTRWFEFDADQPVRWKFHRDGWDGSGGGKRDFQNALAVWNNDPATNIDLVWDRTTMATAGFDSFDGINTILFNDPGDTTSPGSFNCNTGGVLASGGPWFDPQVTATFSGRRHVIIAGADIVTNDGTACFYGQSAAARAEVFAHELGHTLGLGHSCGDDSTPDCANSPQRDEALMRAQVHGDGRGARLGDDDRRGIAKLYPASGIVSGGGGDPVFGLPAPTNLRSTIVNSTSIRLRWLDNSDAEDEYRVQIDQGSGFRLIGTLPADSFRVDVVGLTPNTSYTFRVRARSSSDRSAYSDEVVVVTTP